MKILAALKKIKHIDRKIEKQMKRISKYCSVIMEPTDNAPPYDGEDIKKMIQAVGDMSTEKAAIRSALHLTNVRTKVEFNKKECSIDELLLFQNVVLPAKMNALTALRRKEKGGYGSHATKEATVLNQYEPRDRDRDIEKLEDTMTELDTLLDNLNIETDVVGLD